MIGCVVYRKWIGIDIDCFSNLYGVREACFAVHPQLSANSACNGWEYCFKTMCPDSNDQLLSRGSLIIALLSVADGD